MQPIEDRIRRTPSAWHDLLAILIMSAAIACLYWSPKPMDGTDFASDYNVLHKRRMLYAREALLGPQHTLPGWYTRELLGTPFWSNVSNFPFIPNRLLVVLTMDPYGRYAWTVSVNLSAILAALFTFLFCRRIGLGSAPSATAGFTFVGCGYFACRVGAGQMNYLEVYCALPLLLWAIESLVQARHCARWIVVLAISSMCLSLSGHPQLPIYAMATAAIYALWRGSYRALGAMAVGVGCAAFAIVPMALLILRSTRVLALDPATNDLAMPLRRLLGFFAPWRDGAPPPLPRGRIDSFADHGYTNAADFWDTFCYAGWLPWIAVVLLAGWLLAKRRRVIGRNSITFVTMLGVTGIILCLPPFKSFTSFVAMIRLRSPARIIYLTEFALAIAAGGAIQLALSSAYQRWARWAVPVVLLLHGLDLWRVDREFQPRLPRELLAQDPIIGQFARAAGTNRVGFGLSLDVDDNRRFDDVGFYDSIMLARPYRFLVDLSLGPPGFNRENIDAGQLPARVLQATGTQFIFTHTNRDDDLDKGLAMEARNGGLRIYRVIQPMERVAFCPLDNAAFMDPGELHTVLRDPRLDLRSGLLFPREYEVKFTAPPDPSLPMQVTYRRPDSDHIECTASNPQAGYLRVIESWDPGWSATVDGRPATVLPAMDALLAVGLEPGKHVIRFTFSTPGKFAGIALSLFGLTIAAAWTMFEFRRSTKSPD